MTEKRTVTVRYQTRKVPAGNKSIITASGRCPECRQDYTSSVAQFKRWMRTHLANSHSCKPQWRSTRG